MSTKYIQEYQNSNFIYPNNDPWEYGVDIIHDINNNAVSGTITGFTASISGSNINVSFNYTWSRNGATPFIADNGTLSVLSVHMMSNTNLYFKPWRMIGFVSDANTSLSNKVGTFTATVTPSMMGQASFTAGTYYFEIRLIGKKQINAICVTATVS